MGFRQRESILTQLGGDTVGKCYSEIWSWAISFHVHSSDTTVEGWHTDHTTVLTSKHDGGGNGSAVKTAGRKSYWKAYTIHPCIYFRKWNEKGNLTQLLYIYPQCFVCLKFCDTRAAESHIRLINPSFTFSHTHTHTHTSCRCHAVIWTMCSR